MKKDILDRINEYVESTKLNPQDLKIYFDLDMVFSDFDQLSLDILGKPHREGDVRESWRIFSTIPHFFMKPKLIKGSLNMYNALKHLDCAILTALPHLTGNLVTSEQDKKDWVHKHIDPKLKVICVDGSSAKSQYINKNAVLIDDLKKNIDMWNSGGGIGILHTSPDNTLKKCRELGII